jgi:hypothetical protein
VAESEAPTDDTRRMIEGGPGYPVDGIKESISCELHQRMKNISMKVAVGQALPCPPNARWHGREIPAGYAKVRVDKTKRKRASKNAPSMSSNRRSPPKRKLSPLPKVSHLNLPIRPYDRTPEENARIAKEHYDA